MDKNLKINISINSETAKLDALNSKINTTSKGFNQADTVASSFKSKLDTLNNKIKDTSKGFNQADTVASNFTNRILALGGAYLSLNAAINTGKMFISQADAMNSLDSRLKLATSSTSEYLLQQKKLLEISHDSYTPISDTTTLFTKLNPALKQVGASTEHVNSVVASFTKGLQLGGASIEESKSAILQFAQAMGSGVLRGEEFNAMAEASPKLMEYLAKGLGVPQTALRKMAEEGELTAIKVSNALLKVKTNIEKDFLTMPVTVGKAMTNLSTDFSLAIADIDKATGATASLSGAIQNFTGNLSIYTSNTISFYKEATGFINQHNQAISVTSELAQAAIGTYLGYRVIDGVMGKFTGTMTSLRALTLTTGPIITAVALAGYGLANSFIEGKTRTDNLGKSIDELAKSMTTLDLQTRLNEVNKELAGMDKNIAKYGDSQKLMYQGGYDMAYNEKIKLEESIKLINEKADAQKNAGRIKSLFDNVNTIPENKKNFSELTQEIQKQIDPVRAIHEEYNKLRKSIKGTEADTLEYNKKINENELDAIAKLNKDKISKAEESAKKIAEVEAEFALVGLNEWDTKFKELDNKYNADLVKYKDVIGAKEKLDAIYADNVKNLSNQKNIEAQKGDLSFFERKIQLQDDSLSKELELQGISYSSRVLEIENTTKSLAEKDKLIAKETELFDLTIQNMNYKYDTEFQDTMSNFYDDMLDSQLALNNAVFDFGAGFDGVSSKIGAISKSLAAVGTLELTNKREASKLDKKYIEQFNEYAGDITKTAKLEQQYIKDTALLKEQNLQAQINGYANVASAMSGMFEQGSREAAAFQMVESGLAVVAGIRAILTQGSGDPYTAFGRMATMAMSVATLLSSAKVAFNIGSMKTFETSDYLSGMQQNTGTGTVLGDTTATSESIVQSLELLADYKKPEFDTLQSMNKYLANISNSIGGVSALIVQTGGYAFGEGFESTDTGWKNKISADSNAIKTAGFGTSALQDYIASTGGALGGATIVALGTMLVDKFLLGGTINNLTNKILGGIFGKTSVSTKLKDSGMYFADQLLSNAKDEIYGSMYQTIQTTTTKKSWFKKSTTTDTKTKLQDMEGFTETERQFSLILDNMYNSVVTAADALDTSFNDIVYKLDNFVVSIGMVSMKGLSGQQIQDKLMAIFGKVGDQLSTTVFPLLRPFQQVGEGMYTTMTRVATGMEEAEYYAARLGNSYKDIAYWQLENTQGNVGFEALLKIIQNTEKATNGANTNFIQLINSLDTTAEELYGTYTTLDKLRSTLTYIKLGVDTISFASIKGAGSADALVAGVNAYINGFLDESEQLALNTNLLQKEFSKLNLALPNGKQNFRNLIESIDKTSESGQGLWGSLIVLSDSFATVADSTKESIDTLTSSLEELNTNQFDTFISSLNNIGSSIKNVKNTALGFIQGLNTSSSASLEEQLISYNKMRAEFNNYFENGVIKSGINQDSVSNLYSQISSLASNIAGQDDYLKNSLVNQFKDDITSFNFAEDILKVSIVEGLGYLEGLSSQQINQLKYVLDDGKITIAELNSINGLSQIQKDNILKFANNSDYFSTENTLTSLEDYAQQQLSLMKDNSEKDTSSLSASSFEYGNHIGLKEQIDISKLLGISYGTAKPLIEQLQELSISTDKTKTLNNILGWKDTDTSYDLTKANQISALAPYIEGADVSAYLTNIASTSQQNLLSKQALEKFEAAKAKFNAELLGYETELNSRVSQIGSLQAGYDYWKRKDVSDGEGKKYKPAKDAARAAINDNNANIAKLQALIPQLYQQKTLNGFINGSGNILDDQLAWFNKREIVTPPAFSDGIRSGELSLGNNNEIVAAIESLKKITTEQAKLIQKMADALEEFNNRDLIKTAKGAA